MSRARGAAAVAFVFALSGCESRDDANRRVVAEAEARVYAEAAARTSDQGARATESGHAAELVRLHQARASVLGEIRRQEDFLASAEAKRGAKTAVDEQTRLLGEAKKQLGIADEKIEIQTKLVEGDRNTLTRLKTETEATLANPRADAGLGREILRERLRGIEESLAKCTLALGEKGDAG